ncbi:putative cell surface glycoprotein [Corynebacterium humireducens NBRC 106098 = DSM 45392]|uniref:Putative cell surface glycoprotein n=1 Tax=Corynebacterium humireducens NBRC 106098 = DSM 45392 TaxID=1223515 RepID=A0A0B5D442_9CORY|nr:hypothetical protein [Corynebacterium humireducens]AJE33750.1 putative cell surface glycoprotein [Corynebacterium humireducens NBRC 106098 = DSM 45392]
MTQLTLSEIPLPVLRGIAALHDPTRDEVSAALPENARHLADDIIALLNGRPASAPAFPAPEPEPEPEPEPVIPEPVVPEPEPVPRSTATASLQDLARALEEEVRGQTAAEAARQQVDPALFLDIDPALFDRYQYGSTPDHLSPGITVEHHPAPVDEDGEPQGRGSVLISWEPPAVPAGHQVVYRVVAADREVIASPDGQQTLVTTLGTAYLDEDLGTSGVRHYMVWANVLRSELKEALHSQPTLVGERMVVFPPENFQLVESKGTITGTWDPLPGHAEMRVYAKLEQVPVDMRDPGNQVISGVSDRRFIYEAAERGRNYVFQLVPAAEFRGSLILGEGSAELRQATSADIRQVQLNTPQLFNDGRNERIMLSWTAPPTGSVKIFLSQIPPRPTLTVAPVEYSWIEDDPAFVGEIPTDTSEAPAGSTADTTMTWPEGWHEVYITAVNIVGDKAWAGPSEVMQRVSPITEVRLVERLSSQLITFDWPAGARMVQIETSNSPTSRELLEEDYRRQGGVRVQLAHTGEEVTLTPKSFYAGRDTTAEPTHLRYRGLKTYSYDLRTVDNGTQLLIWRNESEDRNPPRFTLVHNPTSLPLHPHDGRPLRCANVQDILDGRQAQGPVIVASHGLSRGRPEVGSANQVTWWVEMPPAATGYVRLFLLDDDQEQDDSLAAKVVVEGDVAERLRIESLWRSQP